MYGSMWTVTPAQNSKISSEGCCWRQAQLMETSPVEVTMKNFSRKMFDVDKLLGVEVVK